MSSEWRATTLGEVSTWASGGTPKKDEPTYWGGDIPWISANSMHATRFLESDLTLTEAGLKNGSRLASKDTVLLLVRGSALHSRMPVGIALRNLAFNQDVKAITAKTDQIRPWYLLYWLMGNEKFILDSVVEFTGIGAGKLDTKRMQGLDLMLPPLAIQDEILESVKSIDDRITLLSETNTTLEAIAQALFKSWFVDFDPVHAKMQGRAPEGMDEATAALFPDSFEESELGAVPKGWRNVSLKEVVSIHDSKRIPLSGQERDKRKGPYPYYGAAALMDSVDDYLFDGIYLLTGEDGSVADADGYPIMQYVWGKFWVNNHAHILQGKDGVSTEHVMLALQQTNITPYITGAVQAKLSQTNMWRINFTMPNREVAELFGTLLEPIFVLFRRNSEQAKTLSTLRDTLLPRLISGQLSLSEVAAETI
jgi:type I restriction enzyme S subunit